MNKCLALTIVVILASSAFFISNPQPVKADVISWFNCIVIMPDGTIAQTTEPVQAVGLYSYTLQGNTFINGSSQPIQRMGNTYLLTGNIANYTLLVEKSSIIIDGSGFSIEGTTPQTFGVGIYLSELNNITIKNMDVVGFSTGIQLNNSTHCNIQNNALGTISNPVSNGIGLIGSSNNLIANNSVQGGGIINNSFLGDGITIFSSFNNTFSSNLLFNCNFVIDGDWLSSTSLQDYMNTIGTSNLADGKPVYYLVNQTGLDINSQTYSKIGFLALVNCRDVTIENLVLKNLTSTVVFAYLTNSQIISNIIQSEKNGVDIINCSSTQVKDNTITVPYNPEYFQNYALSIGSSINCTVTGNTLVGGAPTGFLLGNEQSTVNNVNKNIESQMSTSPTSTVPELSWLVVIPLLIAILPIALILRHRKT
jgi:nitrous oxidase accessory protein NosD